MEGWKWIINDNDWHYFKNGKSLCKKWATLSNKGLETGNDSSSDNCIRCKNIKEKQ